MNELHRHKIISLVQSSQSKSVSIHISSYDIGLCIICQSQPSSKKVIQYSRQKGLRVSLHSEIPYFTSLSLSLHFEVGHTQSHHSFGWGWQGWSVERAVSSWGWGHFNHPLYENTYSGSDVSQSCIMYQLWEEHGNKSLNASESKFYRFILGVSFIPPWSITWYIQHMITSTWDIPL